MDVLWIIGAVFLAVLVWIPWASIFDWARKEIRSKPKDNVV
jgi:hypothetical protein